MAGLGNGRNAARAAGAYQRNQVATGPAGLAAVAAFCAVALVGSEAHGAFSWATCDPTYGVYFPVDVGANEADRRWGDSSQYGLNEYQQQVRLLVNGNVAATQFYYTNFNTELGYDFLNVQDLNGDSVLTGNLGTGYVGWLFPTGYYGAVNQQFLWTWNSDPSITRQSNPRLDGVRVWCRSSQQTTTSHSSIPTNKRSELLLVASGDVIYTSVYQPASTRLVLTADVLASDDAAPDLDLYASTSTTMPDDSNYQWRGYNGNSGGLESAGEALDLGTAVTSRWVYYGVRSYRGRMHAVLRPNLLKSPGGARSLTVCHPGVPDINQHANWNQISQTLRATSIRTFVATHGNVLIKTFNMKYDPGTGGDKWCSSIAGCDWCMTHTSIPDNCGMQGQVPGRIRVPNASCTNAYNDIEGLSRVLLHEVGHGTFGLTDPVYLEEYNASGTGFCAHSVMNGPQNGAYRFCLVSDHCQNAGTPTPGFDCGKWTGNLWYRIQTGAQASWFYEFPPQGTTQPTAQLWATAHKNTWLKAVAEFTFQ